MYSCHLTRLTQRACPYIVRSPRNEGVFFVVSSSWKSITCSNCSPHRNKQTNQMMASLAITEVVLLFIYYCGWWCWSWLCWRWSRHVSFLALIGSSQSNQWGGPLKSLDGGDLGKVRWSRAKSRGNNNINTKNSKINNNKSRFIYASPFHGWVAWWRYQASCLLFVVVVFCSIALSIGAIGEEEAGGSLANQQH